MKLDLPFYENNGDGKQCMQVAMQVVLKHFLNKEYSLEQLDKLTKRKKEMWTWTSQVAASLDDLGLKIKYYSKTDLEPFLQGESFLREHYGADAEKMLKYTDFNSVMESIEKCIEKKLFERKTLAFKELENNLKKGFIPLVLIDYNKISGKKDLYQGHFVALTGFDKNFVYYHESGPGMKVPNRKIEKNKFIEALNANGTDNDIIIVYGKK